MPRPLPPPLPPVLLLPPGPAADPCLTPISLVAAAQVTPIVESVRSRGDEAVKEYTAKFDRVQLDTVCVPIEVSGE